jgi:hypothetical protein
VHYFLIILWSKVVHFTENRGRNHAIWDETYETANCIFNSDSNPTMATQTEAVNLNEHEENIEDENKFSNSEIS